MCLLVVLSRVVRGAPLVVAANRDERYSRPSQSIAVLRVAAPRILGGRDGLAGGTWLAVNEHGVVAGLTNRPSPAGRDPSKRSRGELPLALAAHRDARAAVEDVASRLRPGDYNPCWLLVGDRASLYSMDMTATAAPLVTELPAGIHVLENRPLGAPSAKVTHVRQLAGGAAGMDGAELASLLRALLADHTVPAPDAPAEARAAGHADPARAARARRLLCPHPAVRHEVGGARHRAERPARSRSWRSPTGHRAPRRSATPSGLWTG